MTTLTVNPAVTLAELASQMPDCNPTTAHTHVATTTAIVHIMKQGDNTVPRLSDYHSKNGHTLSLFEHIYTFGRHHFQHIFHHSTQYITRVGLSLLRQRKPYTSLTGHSIPPGVQLVHWVMWKIPDNLFVDNPHLIGGGDSWPEGVHVAVWV